MTHTYQITGMTCTGCQAKVQGLLSQVAGVQQVSIDLDKGEATLEMEKHISTDTLKVALAAYPKYQMTEKVVEMPIQSFVEPEDTESWLETYKPILLIFGYITLISAIVAVSGNQLDWVLLMRIFMAGFFLVFSFFKLLDLKGFAESYAMYDIVANKINAWGYIYPFVELALGIAYLLNFEPFTTNIITFVVMTISIVGVLQSVLNKRKIKCACLGAVFNLPMSTVTIIEDGLMIAMAGMMILLMI